MSSQSHQINLTYNRDIVREAVFRFWLRSVGKGFFVALTIVGVSLLWAISRGDTSWVTGVVAASFVFGIVFTASLYVVHYRHAMEKFKAMGSLQAQILISESGFTISSGAGSATMPWTAVGQIWRFDKLWLLMFSKGHFVTLPLSSLTPEEQSVILSHVGDAGGKVN